MRKNPLAWDYVIRVTRPALLLAPRNYLADVPARLSEAKIQDAVSGHKTGPLFDWLIASISLQGISDAIALDYDARHGGIRYVGIESALRASPICPRLRCYWSFDACNYRKGEMKCSEPGLQPFCPCRNIRFGKVC